MGLPSKLKWVAMALLPLAAQAQTTVDLTTLDRQMTGPKSQVLVLGTVHLSNLGPGFKPAALGGVLDRLAAYKPDIITIERESGEECDMAARHPGRYGADYCASPAAAAAATGLSVPEAIAAVDKTLKEWPSHAAPAQRRRLAALFLAAQDRASALVQWLHLPESERRAGDSLDDALVAMLAKLAAANNEDYRIAVRLAVRLGLQRVHAVDNHTGDRIDVPDIKAFVRSIEAAWGATAAQQKERQTRLDALAKGDDLLPLYRYINNPDDLRVGAETNVSNAMRATSPEGYPQVWVAGWEIRNLRMVANVRETFRERPGARVLSIVGASHKPWFDSWLGQLQGVQIVDAAKVLK